jgi:integrase
MRKLARDKYLDEEELKRLLLAVRSRVRNSDGGPLVDGVRRKKGDPHPNVKRDYAIFSVASMTGMREIELVGIRIADLRGFIGETAAERPAKIRVRRAKKKGEPVEEDLAIPPSARLALLEYLESIPKEERKPWRRVFAISTRQVAHLFKLYAKKAGLNPAYSMHALRHTRGTLLYKKHKDLLLVQNALGHADMKTTAIYMHTVNMDEKLAQTDLEEDHAPDQGK